MFILLKNKKIKLFIIIIILFILFFILFGLYKYFTYKKEPFQNSCPDCVFNGVDPEHRLNKCNEDPISIPVTGATNTLIGRAISSLNLENVTKSMDSTLWNLSNSNVQADTCPPVATTTGPQTTEVSIPTIKCSYGSLTYVDSNRQPLIDNNQKIIVVHKSDFPDPIETAVGYVINGKNVPENTTILECTVERWNTYGSKKISALALFLSNPIKKYDKDETFCYQPPPINCEIIWPTTWSACVGTCIGTNSTASGTRSQTGTRSVPLGTNLYGGTDCSEKLIQTDSCIADCPVPCQQNNSWTDDPNSTCMVPLTNATCGTGGKKRQTRAPASGPLNDGQACSAEQNLTERQVPCDLPPCATDCELSTTEWEYVDSCVSATGATCGNGTRNKKKKVDKVASVTPAGTCDNPNVSETCSLGPCPGTNCVLDGWVNVNENDKCTSSTGATCGTGKGTILQRQRVTTTASVATTTRLAGTCNNSDTTRECDMVACITAPSAPTTTAPSPAPSAAPRAAPSPAPRAAPSPAPSAAPNAPTITYVGPQTVTATGFTPSRTIGLRLNPPPNIGGSPITEYYIYGGPLLTENSPATISAANIGNIYHGHLIPFSPAITSTTFYLKAKNSVGISPAGSYRFNHSDWIISAEPPRDLSITMIELTNPANTGRITYPPIRNFKLTWTPPANNINGTLTKYIVRYIDKNGATKNIDVTSTSTGLIPVETSINISEFRTEVFVSGTGYGVTYGYDVNGDYTFYVKSVYANGISSTEISKTLKISTTAGVWGQPPTINQRLI